MRRLQLGRMLRERREQAGLSLDVAVPELDWSSSKLSRIENGRQRVDVHALALADRHDPSGVAVDDLLAVA